MVTCCLYSVGPQGGVHLLFQKHYTMQRTMRRGCWQLQGLDAAVYLQIASSRHEVSSVQQLNTTNTQHA